MKATSAKLARSVADAGKASAVVSAIFMAALRAATTTGGGLLLGGMLDSITDKAPAECMGARKAKPPVSEKRWSACSLVHWTMAHLIKENHTISKAGNDLESVLAHGLVAGQWPRRVDMASTVSSGGLGG